MDKQDWQLLRSTPLFAAVSDKAVAGVISGQTPRGFERGTLLFQQGTKAECFYLVLDGWVKIFRTTPSGEETVVTVFRRGETFAEAAIFMGGLYPVSAQTVTACRLLRVDGGQFRRCIHRDPDLALAMLASASRLEIPGGADRANQAAERAPAPG